MRGITLFTILAMIYLLSGCHLIEAVKELVNLPPTRFQHQNPPNPHIIQEHSQVEPIPLHDSGGNSGAQGVKHSSSSTNTGLSSEPKDPLASKPAEKVKATPITQ